MPRSAKYPWRFIGVHKDLADRMDQIVKQNKYPVGRWRGRDEFVSTWMKFILDRYESFEYFLNNQQAFDDLLESFNQRKQK